MTALRVNESSGSTGVVQAADGFGSYIPTSILFNTQSSGLAGGYVLGSDVGLFISGVSGSVGTTTKGVTVFAGDVVISGALFGGSPLKIGGEIQLEGKATFGDAPFFKSAPTFEAGLIVSGSSDFVNKPFFQDGFQVTGSASFEAPPRFDQGFNVSAGTAVFAGATTFNGGTSFEAAPTFAAGLVVSGTSDFVNQPKFQAGFEVTGSTSFEAAPTFDAGFNVAGGQASFTQAPSFSAGFQLTGSGQVAGTINIGDPEDGTYTDGLFPDITSSTLLGTVVDRFNEILALLAPSPAPNLSEVDANNTGSDVYLSFGDNNSLESEPTPYTTVRPVVSLGKDVNDLYQAETTGVGNLKLGVFGQPETITGTLNQLVAQDGINYPANSFGNAEKGVLEIFVNGLSVHQADMTLISSALLTNATGSCFTNISDLGDGSLESGTLFPYFKHRVSGYKIVESDQRQGWNYARIKHTIGSTEYLTNYIAWVNDFNNDALTISNTLLTFTGTGEKTLSGVSYYTGGSIEYTSKVDNAYEKVFDLNPITFSTSITGNNQGLVLNLPQVPKSIIDYSLGENHTKSLHLTASAAINPDYAIGSSFTVGTNVSHPFKSNLVNAGQETINGVLLFNLAGDSLVNYENFKEETFRLVSDNNFNNQSDIIASNFWNSTIHITGSNQGYNDALQFYDQKLYYPTKTLNNGNFSTLNNGPVNPDYSSLTGNRAFLRYFQNTSGSTVKDLKVVINSINSTFANNVSGNNIKISLKIPGKTGWLDLSSSFVYNNIADDAGCNATSVDNSNASTNLATFGLIELVSNEYLILKLEASDSWEGYLDNITVSFPGGTGVITPVPDLNDIDCNNTGVNAKLSFGASKSITDYTNVGSLAGFVSKNLNELYESPLNSADFRRGVFNGQEVITGNINENIPALNPDYPAYSFSDANLGNLILEINGQEIHSADLTTHNSGNTGASNSYFTLSSWQPAKFDNNVPDYSETYRTGTFVIGLASQKEGWNYVRVIHRISGNPDRLTNYIEWVNDLDTSNLSALSSIAQFTDDTFFYLSGVKYFTSPSGKIETIVDNIYKNVYSEESSALSIINTLNCTGTSLDQEGPGLASAGFHNTASSTAFLQIISNTEGSQNSSLNVTGSLDYTGGSSIKSSFQSQTGMTLKNASASIKYKHPIKSNLTTTATATNFLVFQSSDNGTDYNEYFNGESFRIQSGSYNTQASVTNSSNTWNSQTSINNAGNANYSSGLLICGGLLMSPIKGGDNGNFRNKYEASDTGIFEGPDSNVDYSSLLVDTREYFRYFTNPTTNSLKNIFIKFYGDAKLVGRSGTYTGTLGANKNIFVDLKIPDKIEFVDFGVDFATNAGKTVGVETDGALAGEYTNSGIITTSGTNFRTQFQESILGTVAPGGPHHLVLKITADKNWTGYIDRIEITWSSS
tara:strand:+ start:170 stop:4450 length:4281 start_codon:yes stop_codon:yes gene_type:complete